MSCDNVITVQDLETDKKHSTFYREVITGKAGGTGADIDSATNAATGQTQATLPKVLSNVGFSPAGFDFTTGGTITERDKAIFYQTDGNWYSWGGALPKVVPPASSPASTGGIDDNAWNVSTSAFMYRDWEGFTAELLAQGGIPDDGLPDVLGASKRVDAINKLIQDSLPSVNVMTFAPSGTARLTSDQVQDAFDNCPENYKLTFSGAAVDFTKTVRLDRKLQIDFADADLLVKMGFTGTEVFKVGFAPASAYITSGSFVNLSLTFESSVEDIDVFYVSRVARWVMRDVHVYNMVGTLFNETSVGHEWTCENIFCYSADTENGAGIWINFSDSYFTNMKPIGFSEYGIVNDGPDNRYYGCHPWSYPRSQPGFTAFTTKILFWDKEDGMWDSCYADTFQRKDPLQPPSFANGGIAYYFSKVSGIGRMVNCGFYALDTEVDSLIGIATDAGPQQINVVNGYILGSNPNAYLKFVDVPSSAVAVNLLGCNFSETEYQAKETINGSALLSNNEFYIKNRSNSEFNSLQSKLRTFGKRRTSHGLLMFEDNGAQHKMFMWDKYFGASGSLVEIYSSSYTIKTYKSLSQLGLLDSSYAGSTASKFYADVVAAVTASGGFPARLELDVNNSVTPNLISIGAFPGSGYSYEGKLLAADRFTMQAQSYAGDFLYIGRYSTTFSGWSAH